MAQPPPYAPVTSFLVYQAQQAWFPGQQLDVEFNAVNTSITAIEANLRRIQNDDTTLGNGTVGFPQLSTTLATALTNIGVAVPISTVLTQPNSWTGVQTFSSGINTPMKCVVSSGSITLVSGGSNYIAGDRVTLKAAGLTFTTAPILAVSSVSGSAVNSTILVTLGLIANCVPGVYTFTQASTTGSGSGASWTAELLPLAGQVNYASLGTGGAGGANGSVFIGADTPLSTFAGAESVFVGDFAGSGLTGLSVASTCIGHNTGGNGGPSPASGIGNTFVGNDAGRNVTGTAAYNTVIGKSAGGDPAGIAHLQGNANVLLGAYAGASLGNVSNSVFLGYQAGYNVTIGSANIIIGYQVGSSVLVSGQNNVFIGTNASIDSSSAGQSNAVLIGAGSTAVLSILGCGTPSASQATFAGTLTATGQFTVGATGVVVNASSANTGLTNQFNVTNTGTGTNASTVAMMQAQTGLANSQVQLYSQGGSGGAASTRGVLLTNIGLTNGFLLAVQAGPLVLDANSSGGKIVFQSNSLGVGDYGLTTAGTWTFGGSTVTVPSVTVGVNQVVGARATGWTVATGTPQRSTFTTGGVTLAQLAGVVMALQQDLIAHGLIGA